MLSPGIRAPFSLVQFQVFLAVLETGSATSAGIQLNLSQPAVSQHIRELERTTNMALFRRRPRGLEPTDAALAMKAAVLRAVTGASDAWSIVAELHGLERGNLRIGASLTIATYSVPPILGTFNRRYPSIHVELRMANSTAVATWTSNGEVDLGLIEGHPPDDLDVHPYRDDDLVLVGPPDTDLKMVAAKDLPTLPLILREPGSGTRALVDDRLASLGIAVVPRLELGSPEAIKRLVQAGLGYSIISRLAVERELGDGRLREVPLQGLDVTRQFAWVARPGDPLGPAARALIGLLTA